MASEPGQVADHAEDTNRRDEQCRSGQHADNGRHHLRPVDVIRDDLLEGLDAHERERRVDAADGLLERRPDVSSTRSRSDDPRDRKGLVRHTERRHRSLCRRNG